MDNMVGDRALDENIVDFALAPPEHNVVLGNLNIAVAIAIRNKGYKCMVLREQPFKWEKDNKAFRMPDLSIVCGDSKRIGMYFTAIPRWIAEVVSESTEQEDRIEKCRLYASIGVAEYWLVDPLAHKVERYILTSVVENPAALNPNYDPPVLLMLHDVLRHGEIEILTMSGVTMDLNEIFDLGSLMGS